MGQGEVKKRREYKWFTEVIKRDRPRKAVTPLVLLWFHVEAQGGRRVQTYRRKKYRGRTREQCRSRHRERERERERGKRESRVEGHGE